MDSSECLLVEDALAMNSHMPMKQVHSCVVCTKNFYFVVPTKTVGMFVLFDTIKNHAFFEGLSIQDGLKKLISETSSVDELESKLKELLENNDKYIFDLSEAKSTKIKGFLGKKTFMYRRSKSWASFSPKTKAAGKLLADFYDK
ncbi:MAG: hypothetical protein HUJ25_04955 [Crocinitomicaceae bacterium]|nr:hypothetical protein [Crocinitomicaceae bacterium]